MSIFISYCLLGAVAGPLTMIFGHSIARNEAPSWNLVATLGWVPLLAASVFLSGSLIYVVHMVPTAMTTVVTWLVILGLLLALIDWGCHRLPHRVVGALLTGGMAQFGVIGLLRHDAGPLVRAGLAALLVFVIGLAIYLRLQVSLGFGDVTLAAAVGAHLGWFGWHYVLPGLTAGLVFAATTTLVLLAFRRIRRGDHVALGPSLIAGAVYTILHL
ncbi:MAG: hypothetical protein HOV94_40460 [Saccharothrix sp.]|nr:hypothetical protein [Saccharothrix sp.]